MNPTFTAERPRLRRVLVIRRRALGDAVVTLPAVRALAAAWPQARIDLLVDRPFAPLLREIADRVRVVSWPPDRADAPAGWIPYLRAQRYELVVDILSTPRTALWTALSGARWRAGYALRWRRWAYNLPLPRDRLGGIRLSQFAAEGFLELARELGADAAPWRPGEFAPSAVRAGGDGWPGGDGRPRIGLALSATWPVKAWPAAEAVALMRALAARGAAALLIPGPGDGDLVAAVRAADPSLRIAPATDLLELTGLLGRLDALVATDCGPRHIAAGLGVPTVTLFGPTDPRGWNPEHPLHIMVRTGEPCSPCDLLECPVAGHPCMTGLRAGRVLAALDTVLGRLPAAAREAT
ncbi:MAG: glycosyltransferase family 9 protein [bacterium]|nr:glycosyltransferase family 9 protein [bacterium]